MLISVPLPGNLLYVESIEKNSAIISLAGMPWKQFSPLFIWLECRLVLHPPDRYRQSAEWTMEWTIKFTPPHLSSTWSSRPCTPTYGLPIKVHTFSSSTLRNSTGMKLKFCEWYLNVEVALSKKQKLLSVSFSFCLSLSLGTKLKPQHIALSFSIWHSRSQWSRCRVFRSGSA